MVSCKSIGFPRSNTSGLITYNGEEYVSYDTTEIDLSPNNSKVLIEMLDSVIKDNKLIKIIITKNDPFAENNKFSNLIITKQPKERIQKNILVFLKRRKFNNIEIIDNKISGVYNFLIEDKFHTKFSCKIILHFDDGWYDYKISKFKTHINNTTKRLERYSLNKKDKKKLLKEVNSFIEELLLELK